MALENTITDYKNKIITKIIENENLLKALTNTDSDFISQTLSISAPEDVVYSYVFPYMDSKTILTETQSFITMEFRDFKSSKGNYYKSGQVLFYIICEKSLIKTSMGNRYDYIFERLMEIFDESKDIGIGKMIISKWGDMSFGDDYLGCYCILELTDFK